jgi:hypothetical protein
MLKSVVNILVLDSLFIVFVYFLFFRWAGILNYVPNGDRDIIMGVLLVSLLFFFTGMIIWNLSRADLTILAGMRHTRSQRRLLRRVIREHKSTKTTIN